MPLRHFPAVPPARAASRASRVFLVRVVVAVAIAIVLLVPGDSAGAQQRRGSGRSTDSAATQAAPRRQRARVRAGQQANRADSTPPARPTGATGRNAGDRHLAFRDTGSELDSLWPPKMPAPLPGSLLPARRIVAFYGNPLSRRMGILGEFDPEVMLR